MEKWRVVIDGMKPTFIMIVVQFIFAFVNIAYKLAANDGMRLPILVAYRFSVGAAFVIPVAFFLERKKRPKLTWKVVFYAFLCGLFGGSLGQNLFLKSLALTSPTFVSAMTNLIPAITFLVAVCMRLERLGWTTSVGKAKVLGTALGLSGAMVITFYRGPMLNLWHTKINLLDMTTRHRQAGMATQSQNHGHNIVLGAILGLLSCILYSFWLIAQAAASRIYPCPYSITAMVTMWASVQGFAYALCTERDWSQWKLGWNIRSLVVVISGVMGSGLMFSLTALCIRMRGPLFVSMFTPLLLVMVAIGDWLLLQEKLYLGLILGAILIVFGLYVVLWAKGKELKMASTLAPAPAPANDEEVAMPGSGGNSHSDELRQKEEAKATKTEKGGIPTPDN